MRRSTCITELAGRRLLAAAKEAGVLRPDVDPETTATSLLFLSQALVGPVLIGLLTRTRPSPSSKQRFDEVFRHPRTR